MNDVADLNIVRMRSSFSGRRGKGVRLKRRYPVAALRSARRIRWRLPQKRGAGTLLFGRHRLACSVQPANAADRREPQTGSRGFRGAPIRRSGRPSGRPPRQPLDHSPEPGCLRSVEPASGEAAFSRASGACPRPVRFFFDSRCPRTGVL